MSIIKFDAQSLHVTDTDDSETGERIIEFRLGCSLLVRDTRRCSLGSGTLEASVRFARSFRLAFGRAIKVTEKMA